MQGLQVEELRLSAEPGYDESIDELIDSLNTALNNYMNSDNDSDRFISRVFNYSTLKFKNVKRFSIESKIPYNVCLRAYNEFKNKVKCGV